MPVIFASAILMFPQQILSQLGAVFDLPFLSEFSSYFVRGSVSYYAIFGSMILFFSYFWVSVMFKPIQMGIPTVILRGQGETGNFKGYPGMVSPSYDNILKSIKMQQDNGRFDDYINSALSGGLNFNSIELYVNYIKGICEK